MAAVGNAGSFMRMRHLSGRLPAAVLIVFSASCARAARSPDAALLVSTEGPVALHNGVNDVALLGDATPGKVIVSWRGNYNGHGYSVAEFVVRKPSDLGDAAIWQDVPFFGGPHDGETGREVYRTAEGADCTLSDIRVVGHPGRPADVIIASRGLGPSFADPAAVRFDYYRVTQNREGVVGWPPTYFQFVRSEPARRSYCDVNEAFARELKLGADGLGHAEGGR
jgi:hypothetical protein